MESVCDLHDGIPQHAVSDAKALFKLFHDNALAVGIIFDVHDGVVAVGVKRFADGFDLRHAELIERGVILVHDALDALTGGVVVRGLCQCARQTVVHRQELFERLAADIGIDVLALTRAASAEVVIFGEQAEVFVLFRREIGLDLFFRLFLFLGLFGFLGGFGLFFLALLLRGLLVRLFFGVRRDRRRSARERENISASGVTGSVFMSSTTGSVSGAVCFGSFVFVLI